MPAINKCTLCGDEYETQRSRAAKSKYCSRRCRDESYRKGRHKPCAQCGKKFYVKPALERVRFCSTTCYHKSMEEQFEKTCKHCGTDFTVERCRKDEAVYCSWDCAMEAQQRPRDELGNLRCSSCKEYMPPDEFHNSSFTLDGFSLRCKECSRHRWNARRAVMADTDIDPGFLRQLRHEGQGNLCAYCATCLDDVTPHLDHKQPISKGGTHTRDNVQWLCSVCNVAKRDTPHDETMLAA